MSECLSCKNEFVQPFVCATCGAEKLYDATLKTAQDQAALWEADLFEANARIAEQKGLTIMACMNVTELEIRCANLRLKLDSENAANSLKWRTMFQNERDHMNAALLEIDRLKTVIGEMTINQQMQDSITAAVMERAEKAEKAEAENKVVRSMYLKEVYELMKAWTK